MTFRFVKSANISAEVEGKLLVTSVNCNNFHRLKPVDESFIAEPNELRACSFNAERTFYYTNDNVPRWKILIAKHFYMFIMNRLMRGNLSDRSSTVKTKKLNIKPVAKSSYDPSSCSLFRTLGTTVRGSRRYDKSTNSFDQEFSNPLAWNFRMFPLISCVRQL